MKLNMEKRHSDSTNQSQDKGLLHNDNEEKDGRYPGAPSVETEFKRSPNEKESSEERNKDTRSEGERSEDGNQWELTHKREASRLSSMRCQQRKRKRMTYLSDEEDRLKVQNQNIGKQNTFLRKLISAIKDATNEVPSHDIKTNPIAMAQVGTALYNQGVLGAVQPPQQPHFNTVAQEPPATQSLKLSLALMAAISKQQIQRLPNSALPSPAAAIINPLVNPPPPRVPHPFVATSTINPANINPQMQINSLLQNAFPGRNTLPTLQDLVAMAQSGLHEIAQHSANPIAAALQQQPIFWHQTNLNQMNNHHRHQSPRGAAVSINMNDEEASAWINSIRSQSYQ
ncbi:MAG: hypothetical protein SGBAC_005495 [Bacillariaceae sp.]